MRSTRQLFLRLVHRKSGLNAMLSVSVDGFEERLMQEYMHMDMSKTSQTGRRF